MSDDLISRKDLLGTERLLMTEIAENNKVARCILEQVLYDIEHAPVAFDKGKVVDQLKEEGCIIDDEAGLNDQRKQDRGGERYHWKRKRDFAT